LAPITARRASWYRSSQFFELSPSSRNSQVMSGRHPPLSAAGSNARSRARTLSVSFQKSLRFFWESYGETPGLQQKSTFFLLRRARRPGLFTTDRFRLGSPRVLPSSRANPLPPSSHMGGLFFFTPFFPRDRLIPFFLRFFCFLVSSCVVRNSPNSRQEVPIPFVLIPAISRFFGF